MTDLFRQDMIRWLELADHNGDFSDEDLVGQGLTPLTIEDGITIAVGWGKSEILQDVWSGTVPVDIRSFSELHDYVDANGYGGAFSWPCLYSEEREDSYQDLFCKFWNKVQRQLDKWIVDGEMRKDYQQAFGGPADQTKQGETCG